MTNDNVIQTEITHNKLGQVSTVKDQSNQEYLRKPPRNYKESKHEHKMNKNYEFHESLTVTVISNQLKNIYQDIDTTMKENKQCFLPKRKSRTYSNTPIMLGRK